MRTLQIVIKAEIAVLEWYPMFGLTAAPEMPSAVPSVGPDAPVKCSVRRYAEAVRSFSESCETGPGGEPTSDISSSGDSGKIVDLPQDSFLRHALKNAQIESSGSAPASGECQAHKPIILDAGAAELSGGGYLRLLFAINFFESVSAVPGRLAIPESMGRYKKIHLLTITAGFCIW
jgi:hypothetical protein